jgi:hypothetical protein
MDPDLDLQHCSLLGGLITIPFSPALRLSLLVGGLQIYLVAVVVGCLSGSVVRSSNGLNRLSTRAH